MLRGGGWGPPPLAERGKPGRRQPALAHPFAAGEEAPPRRPLSRSRHAQYDDDPKLIDLQKQYHKRSAFAIAGAQFYENSRKILGKLRAWLT